MLVSHGIVSSWRALTNKPGSCCHPKIAADLKAITELNDAATLFTQLQWAWWKSRTSPLAPASTGGKLPFGSVTRPPAC